MIYAGRPAVTVNRVGKGKAWHVASRNDLPFQRDFFAAIINELALPRAIEGISRRVWSQQRTDGETTWCLCRTLPPSNSSSRCRRVYRLHDRRRRCGRYRAAGVGLPGAEA
jgi:beta-galactosidase GanA